MAQTRCLTERSLIKKVADLSIYLCTYLCQKVNIIDTKNTFIKIQSRQICNQAIWQSEGRIPWNHFDFFENFAVEYIEARNIEAI